MIIFDSLLSYDFLLNTFICLSILVFMNYLFIRFYPEKIIKIREIRVRNENIIFYVLISALLIRLALQYLLGWSHELDLINLVGYQI